MIRLIALALLIGAIACGVAFCQTAPSDAAPARKSVAVPPGFELIVAEGRNVLCREGDESWVRQVIADRMPTSRPSTMPADLVERLTETREVLIDRITDDLALPDRAVAARFVEQELIPLASRAANYRPPLYYLVTTRDGLREIVKGGWTDPAGGYHYNRAADQVSVPGQMQITLDGDTDDQVLPAIYDPADDLTSRSGDLKKLIYNTESQMNFVMSTRALVAVQSLLLKFIDETALTPLKLERDDQQWFNIGVGAVLSARYLAMINGAPADTFLDRMTRDDPRNPVRSATVNLLSPMSLSDMRPVARPAYADALRRKATDVIADWIEAAPSGSLPRVINAIRANPPADGAALAKLVTEVSGIDLTSKLLSR